MKCGRQISFGKESIREPVIIAKGSEALQSDKNFIPLFIESRLGARELFMASSGTRRKFYIFLSHKSRQIYRDLEP
jgi:hypothetical protein